MRKHKDAWHITSCCWRKWKVSSCSLHQSWRAQFNCSMQLLKLSPL